MVDVIIILNIKNIIIKALYVCMYHDSTLKAISYLSLSDSSGHDSFDFVQSVRNFSFFVFR